MSTRYRFTHPAGILALCLLAFALVGCAPTQVRQKAGHHEAQESVSVLLMPVDIELSALTAGGINEVRANWTEIAKSLVSDSLKRHLAKHNDQLLEYVEPNDLEQVQQHTQIMKLHGVVGEMITLYTRLPAAVPPTKKDIFDWSLGVEVTRLRDASGADYGLFIYLRDSYATAGRKALIVTSALLGVNVTAGRQSGFATLVDLHDGSVVWFNQIDNQIGDLRTKGAAYSTVEDLIEDIPL